MLSIQELRSSTKKELLHELSKAHKEMLKIRINVKTKHEKDSSKAKKSKHYIAQILTILKEIEKEEQEKSQTPSPKSQEKAEKSK